MLDGHEIRRQINHWPGYEFRCCAYKPQLYGPNCSLYVLENWCLMGQLDKLPSPVVCGCSFLCFLNFTPMLVAHITIWIRTVIDTDFELKLLRRRSQELLTIYSHLNAIWIYFIEIKGKVSKKNTISWNRKS